jgi:hypothetical protein
MRQWCLQQNHFFQHFSNELAIMLPIIDQELSENTCNGEQGLFQQTKG